MPNSLTFSRFHKRQWSFYKWTVLRPSLRQVHQTYYPLILVAIIMSASTPTQTWLVTGSSRGLGYHIVLQALKAGHKVLASTRDPSKSTAEIVAVKEAGGIWIELNVSATNLEQRLETIVKDHGPIDVLVNNAAYAGAGAVEDVP